MLVIERSEALQLGDAAIDVSHVELCALLNVVTDVSDAGFTGAFDTFIDYIEHHFVEENARTDAADFLLHHHHRGEHDNVLTLYREMRGRVITGRMELGRRLVVGLPAWFAQHVDVMDRITTTYLV